MAVQCSTIPSYHSSNWVASPFYDCMYRVKAIIVLQYSVVLQSTYCIIVHTNCMMQCMVYNTEHRSICRPLCVDSTTQLPPIPIPTAACCTVLYMLYIFIFHTAFIATYFSSSTTQNTKWIVNLSLMHMTEIQTKVFFVRLHNLS